MNRTLTITNINISTGIRFYKAIPVIIMLSLMALPLSAAGQTDSTAMVNQFMKEMSSGLQNVTSIYCQFTQERRMAILAEPITSKGICLFSEPEQLRWEVTAPYHSIMIYSKGQMAKFEKSGGKLKKLQLGAADMMRQILKQIISWMKGNFDSSRNMYDIRIHKSAAQTHLVLVPKSEKLLQNIRAIEIDVESTSYHVTKVVIQETPEDATIIRFFNQTDNKILDPALFDLNQPIPIPTRLP